MLLHSKAESRHTVQLVVNIQIWIYKIAVTARMSSIPLCAPDENVTNDEPLGWRITAASSLPFAGA